MQIDEMYMFLSKQILTSYKLCIISLQYLWRISIQNNKDLH